MPKVAERSSSKRPIRLATGRSTFTDYFVHDKIIAPMPEDQVGERTIRHRLASWYAHLPQGHPLLR